MEMWKNLEPKSMHNIIPLSFQFLDLPYVWGGTSSEGFDCSGYIQTLIKQMGVILPRDSLPQSVSEKLIVLDYPENPGDLVFFGKNRVSHVGLYLANGAFIHSGVRNNIPKISVITIEDSGYDLLAARRIPDVKFSATVSEINDEIKSRMTHSWKDNNPVPLDDLRYVQLTHWGFDQCIHDGELIVHKDVSEEVVDIFDELFSKRYPIEKMVLVDVYEANDDLSCEDNNSSAFCSRTAVGKSVWSYHSLGLAIDINPLLNPYHKGDVISPINGKLFLDRSLDCIGIINHNDPCYKAFVSRGWKWAGDWMEERGYVDYQHFYKEL